ncbi:MAG: hypothetical protein HKN32_00840, partial [Flavobacteriales bacterium]|nr:hypothetical protein [Flavobacteriales bacterium]
HLTWVDFDNDNDPDIFFTRKDGACELYENAGDLTFTNISAGAGFPNNDSHHVNGVCWGDYDKDGFLDVYLTHFNDQYYPVQYTNWLMRNLGDGTFENVTVAAGVGNGYSRSFQASFVDYNGDTWPDIYVINDRYIYANALFKNNGDGTFEDVSSSTSSGIILDAMSSSWADYDNDEDLDGYITNGIQGNVMLHNDGGVFSDSTDATGLVVNGVCWSANWADFENDGDQDVYVCTMDNGEYESDNHAYRNDGSGPFQPIHFASFPDDEFQSWSNISGDINNDGFVDLVSSVKIGQNNPVWMNEATSGNHFVKFELQGTTTNADGIGAWVKVYSGGIVQSRYTACGEDYLCQDSQREIIGLGQSNLVDSIVVLWPTGHEDVLYDLPVDQNYEITEGQTIGVNIDLNASPELCEGESITLAGPGGFSYEWNTGETTQEIIASTAGEYWLTVTNEHNVSATSEAVSVSVSAASWWYPDNDGDGFGDGEEGAFTCDPPLQWVTNDQDCDDENASVYPGAEPTGEGNDNNCNGSIDQSEATCPGDLNFDGVRNTADLLGFLAEIGCASGCIADFNDDQTVNTSDLLSFLAYFGIPCP